MARASNKFSIAKDLQLVLNSPVGALQLPKITGFEAKAVYETVKSKVLDGPTRQVSLPDGYNISIKFDREDGVVDTFFAGVEAAYWAANGYVPQFSLSEFIAERDGSSSEFMYDEFDLQYEPGSWKSGSPVSGEIKGYARYKRKM